MSTFNAQMARERPIFDATWESLNARPTPEWFGDAKFGIFIHWGVYSVPAYCHPSSYSEWYWHWLKNKVDDGKLADFHRVVADFHKQWYGPDFEYKDFAPQFRAELWKPNEWAQLFKRAGAKYVVLVSKHHDGYPLWPNAQACTTYGWPWNSMVVGLETRRLRRVVGGSPRGRIEDGPLFLPHGVV